jgi:hypothetical protein
MPVDLERGGNVNCRGLRLGFIVVAAACGQNAASQPNEALRLDLEEHAIRRLDPDLLIGEVLGPSEYTFAQLVDVAATARGDLLALDSQEGRVSVYSEAGSFVKAWGRPGSGPGEFRWPRRLLVSESRIGVWDQLLRRLSWFDDEGRLIESEVHQDWSVVSRVALLSDGSVIVQAGPSWNAPPTPDNGIARLFLVRPNGMREEIVEWSDSAAVYTHVTAQSSAVVARPFTTMSEWALINDWLLVFRRSGANVLRLFAIHNTVAELDSLVFEGRQWRLSRREQQAVERRHANFPEPIREIATVPSSKPLIRAMTAGEGQIWLHVSTADDQDESTWVVLSCTGTVESSVRIPSDVELRRITPHGMLGISRDSLGVSRIARFANPTQPTEPCQAAFSERS